MPDLRLENLEFSYRKKQIIPSTTTQIPEGSCVLMEGPSGSGKTTLLKLLGGILKPSKGKILLNQKPIRKSARNEIFGYAFVEDMFFEDFSVEENIRVFAEMNHIPLDEKWYNTIIDTFEIRKILQQKLGEISAGQRERVNLARAFIHKPKILILDEPTSHLDSGLAQKIQDFIFQYQKENTATLVVSSHICLDSSRFDTFIRFYENHTLSIHTNS